MPESSLWKETCLRTGTALRARGCEILRTKQNEVIQFVAVVVLYLAYTVFCQWMADAPTAGFGTFPDEPAHYIGGLLVRDYAAMGARHNPLAFAEDYRQYLPYFAIGHWPPLFYCFEAMWVLLFGSARGAVLLLEALFATGTAGLIFYMLRREAGWFTGFCGGVLFLALPEVQRQFCTVMIDVPVTFWSICATVFAARFLASERRGDSVAFAVCAAAACLTKYSALYICALCFLGAAVLGRWRLFRTWTLWLQPAIILALVGPWVWFTSKLALQDLQMDLVGLPNHPRETLIARVMMYVKSTINTVPVSVWLLIGLGLAAWVFRRKLWSETRVIFLLHPCILLAFIITSHVASDRRYFIPGAAALLVAALAGVDGWRGPLRRHALAVVGGCTVLTIGWSMYAGTPLRPNLDYPVADRILAESRWKNAAILMPEDAEGPMIAELAMKDPRRPGYRLLRPDKALASDDWFGGNYKSFCQTPAEAQAILDQLQVQLVILRSRPPRYQRSHEVMLRMAVADQPDTWRRVEGAWLAKSQYEIFERRLALGTVSWQVFQVRRWQTHRRNLATENVPASVSVRQRRFLRTG
jgi:hypothetical protein